MKVFWFVSILLLKALLGLECSYAQEHFFVFIQSQNHQPYTIYHKNENVQSNNNGCAVIPQIIAADSNIYIEFNNRDQLLYFKIKITEDRGFILFQKEDSTWAMVDQENNQTFTSLPFANIDSVLRDSSMIKSVKSNKKNLFPLIPEPYNAKIVKKETIEDSNGIFQIFYDTSAKESEKITVFIPINPKKKLTIQHQYPINKLCEEATDNDFKVFKNDLITQTKEEDKLKVSRKFFATKSLKSLQIKELGLLFTNDTNRLLFFSNAKPAITDYNNFQSLQYLLVNPQNIHLFNNLLF